MTSHEKRVLEGAIADLRTGRVPLALASLVHLLPPKRRAPRSIGGTTLKEDKASKKMTKRQKTSAVYDQVSARAAGNCEAAGELDIRCSGWLEMDHLYQGSGNREHKESVSTCAMLCKGHHDARTANLPSVREWNLWCFVFADLHGYEPVKHIEKQAVAR